MNEERHWNNIAKSYNEEIFDVFASDKKKLLHSYFNKHANSNGTAIDFGCGNGKALPYLSPRFKKVIGIDISKELLKQAKAKQFQNATFLHRDLSKPKIQLPKVDFVFSCNVIMLPIVQKNKSMLKNVARALKKGGSVVLVVPSAESILFSGWRLIDLYQREGTSPQKIASSELTYFKSKTEIVQGIFYIDGVPTKHYSAPELEVILTQAGMKLQRLEKLEYDWATEFASPPKWMQAPYPWDWLVECTKS